MHARELERKLGLTDAVAIVAGTMIGSGIFIVPNLVARNLTSPTLIVLVWVFSGVLSFFGALAFAELGAMIPATGGEYVYLRESSGSLVAFLGGWTYFAVVLSSAVAFVAVSFARYLEYFIKMGPAMERVASVAVIAAVTLVNYRGVTAGAAVQKTFTAIKFAGLGILIFAALTARSHAPQVAPASTGFSASHFGVAMIACLLAYDGWVALSFVAGEVKHPRRNLPLAAFLGVLVVIAVYVLANLAYLRVLSVSEIAAADRVGALAAQRAIGSAGAAVFSLTVLVSMAGCLNGWALTAPRIFFAQARDGLFFHRFGEIHPRYQTPGFSILAFGAWAAILAVSGAYESLASFAMFAAWVFYALTAAGVMILRRTQPARPRPYRMLGYPFTLALFLAVALAFVVNTLISTPGPALAGTALITCGVPVYFAWRRKRAAAQPSSAD